MKKILLISVFMSSVMSFLAKGVGCDEDVEASLQAWYIPVFLGAQMHVETNGRDLVVETFKPEKTEKYYTVQLALAQMRIKKGYTKLDLEIPKDMKAELKVPTTINLEITGDESNVVWHKKSE